jgi:hypothetical protein
MDTPIRQAKMMLDPNPQKCPLQLHCKSLRLLNLDTDVDLDQASEDEGISQLCAEANR